MNNDDRKIPFLKPHVVPVESYLSLLSEIDNGHIYTNFGPLNDRFEKQLVHDLLGDAGFATTVSNATLGLVLAISAVRTPQTKYAIMPSFTFAATAHAAVWAGLTPYFVDIDPLTWQVDWAEVDNALDYLGASVCMVVPYATFGVDLDPTPIAFLEARGIPVVVDAAASLGGQSFWSDIDAPIVFSMHATKAFPVGEGGVVYSSGQQLIEAVRRRSNFGFDAERSAEVLGLNAKLPEVSAAIALATLKDFSSVAVERRGLYARYHQHMADVKLLDQGWICQGGAAQSVPQFMSVLAPTEDARCATQLRLEQDGIQSRTYFSPTCHESGYFRGHPHSALSVTEDVASRIISLPLWPGMTDRQVARVVAGLTA